MAQRNDSDTFSGKVEDVEEVAVPRSAPLRTVARAWVTGARWPEWAGAQGRRIPLPTYPFARIRHCVTRAAVVTTEPQSTLQGVQAEHEPAWVETEVDWSERALESYAGLVLFGVDEATRQAVLAQTQNAFPVVLVTPGQRYQELGSLTYEVRPHAREDFVALLDGLWREGIVPDRISFPWPGADEADANVTDAFDRVSLELLQSLLLAESLPRAARLLLAQLEPYHSERPGSLPELESLHSTGIHLTHCEIGDGAWNDDAIEALLLELACEAPAQRARWSQGRRWVEVRDADEASGSPATNSEIRELRSKAAEPAPALRLLSAHSAVSS